LPELDVQYSDYAAWQRGWLDDASSSRAAEHWRRVLTPLPQPLKLPGERPRAHGRSGNGARVVGAFTPAQVRAVDELVGRYGATRFMTLLTIFDLLLARSTSCDDIVVGVAAAGRTRCETEPLIGYFVNMLPIRVRVAGNPCFTELLDHVRRVVLAALAYQDVPTEAVLKKPIRSRSGEASPPFRVCFAVQGTRSPAPTLPGIALAQLPWTDETARYDLTVWVAEHADGLVATWTYSTDIFDRIAIERMQERFASLVASVAADPEARLDSFDMQADAAQAAGDTWLAEQTHALRRGRRQAVAPPR
jgi:non-ribosomal peptide synthetase component F